MKTAHVQAINSVRWMATIVVLTMVGVSVVTAAEPKLIQMGWDTPTPVEAAQKIVEAMQRVPFDGVVFQLTSNGFHDLADGKSRHRSFVYRCWGKEKLKTARNSPRRSTP